MNALNTEKFRIDKEQKSTRITLDQLGKTIAANNYDVPSHRDGIMEILKKIPSGKIKDIYVANSPRTGFAYNDSSTGDPLKQSLLEYYIFRRLVALIEIPAKINGGTLQLAVKYDNNRFTLALGANISICSNLMILGHGDTITTGLRGKDRMDFESALAVVGKWNENYKTKVKAINENIASMERNVLLEEEVDTLVGILARKSVLSPANQILKGYQVTNLCKSINHAFIDEDPEEQFTCWDFWNRATNDLKPFNTDLSSYIENTTAITKFCCSFARGTTQYAEITQ